MVAENAPLLLSARRLRALGPVPEAGRAHPSCERSPGAHRLRGRRAQLRRSGASLAESRREPAGDRGRDGPGRALLPRPAPPLTVATRAPSCRGWGATTVDPPGGGRDRRPHPSEMRSSPHHVSAGPAALGPGSARGRRPVVTDRGHEDPARRAMARRDPARRDGRRGRGRARGSQLRDGARVRDRSTREALPVAPSRARASRAADEGREGEHATPGEFRPALEHVTAVGDGQRLLDADRPLPGVSGGSSPSMLGPGGNLSGERLEIRQTSRGGGMNHLRPHARVPVGDHVA
jgi:hypothetical protein